MAKKEEKQEKPKPRQKDLPGLEDRKLQELHGVAEVYAEVRDSRMKLTKRETELQADLLRILKKHGKKDYVCGDVEVHLIVEKEKVKVKIHKPKDAEEE